MAQEELNLGADPYRRLFTESSVALAFLDEGGFIVDANENFKRTFESLSGNSLDGMDENFPEFLRSRDAFRFSYHFSRLITGSTRSVSFETSFRNASGSPRWLKIRAWAVDEREDAPPHRRGPYVALAVEDETDEHQEEKRLQEAKEIAERSMETKSQFLANMSHEIRTPIQTIIGMTELMQDTALNREQSEYARQVKFSADVLLSLINDILDYSKIEAGRLELERFDFDPGKTVEQAVDMICLEAHKKNLEISVDIPQDIPQIIKGDPNRFRQIVINLVKNAVKFTREGGVTVSIRRTEYGEKEGLTVFVADTGIGVPAELRPRLFTTFFQGDASTTRRFGGTGLGLAISRHLVQLMKGEIGMTANDGGGSLFRFTVPVERSEFTQARSIPRAKDDQRILVVDDRSESRRVVLSYLADLGYAHNEEAASGEEALGKMKTAAAAGRPYELCFIDMIMPQMDGWRLAAEINQNKLINGARLVLLVPQGMMGSEAKMTLLRWFNAYITKPVKRQDVQEAITATASAVIDLEASTEPDLAARNGLPGINSHSEGIGVLTLQQPLGPNNAGAAEEDGTTPVPADLSGRPLVLIVEDHPVNQKLFSLILEKLGYPSIIADDGVDALEKIADRTPALVFMDIQMPRMNGYETTERLRQRGAAFPIIAVTASALSDEREHCLKVGMNDVLVKPFKRPDIKGMLDKWINYRADQKAEEPEEVEEFDEPEEFEELEELEELDESVGEGDKNPGPSGTPEPSAAPGLNDLDPNELLETFFGKKDTVDSLLARFVERTAEQIAKLPKLIEAEDWETARREAHTIKGSAMNLQAKNLGNTAAALETAILEQDGAAMQAALPRVDGAFKLFAIAAKTFMDTPGGDKKAD